MSEEGERDEGDVIATLGTHFRGYTWSRSHWHTHTQFTAGKKLACSDTTARQTEGHVQKGA